MRSHGSKFKKYSLFFGTFLSFVFLCLIFNLTPLHNASAGSTANFTIEIIPGPQCFDGQDNDGDGKIDHPDDPGCGSQGDDDETDPAPSGGGGGGGGYVPPPVQTAVNFSGRAYPKSTVTLLKDAQIAATTVAGTNADFQMSLSGLSGGNYIFSVYSEDSRGVRSSLLTFPIGITAGATTRVSGIFLAPTIAVDKSEMRRGDNVAIFGRSAPWADIIISVNSEDEFFAKTASGATGVYLYNFDTSVLDHGLHYTKSKAALSGEISSFSRSISFTVGDKTILSRPEKCPLKGDLNGDCRVNLVDFSIAAYWYKKPILADFTVKEKERLNDDGKVDLIDFSIMAFYWTG